MKEFSLNPDVIAFINRYLEISGLSTATSVNQQRIGYDAMVQKT